MPTLSVIIPAYNEQNTIATILDAVAAVELIGGVQKELIVVNDASSDETESRLMAYREAHPELNIQYFKHEKNKGKGAALHTGIAQATGDYVVVQDADLEYDPQEFNVLLKPVLDGFADVVYGSRFMGGRPHRILFFWHSIGNKFLTFLSNMFTNLNLTDMETCYKLFRRETIQSLKLKENRFGFEPEVTAKPRPNPATPFPSRLPMMACSVAPATPKLQWISPAWPISPPPASSARSCMRMAPWRASEISATTRRNTA